VWLETDATEYTGITTWWITLIKKTKEKVEERKKHLNKEDSFFFLCLAQSSSPLELMY